MYTTLSCQGCGSAVRVWLTKRKKQKYYCSKHCRQAKVYKKASKKKRAEPRSDFYQSEEWLRVRYLVFLRSKRVCELCGATKKDGVRFHVDHIKPRSIYPKLELDPDNLQLLCSSCNLGKSNLDETDWRAQP